MLLQPYYRIIAGLLDDRFQRPCLLLSALSFTPDLNSQPRPWHIAPHWHDRRLAALIFGVLSHRGEFTVGDNELGPIDVDFDSTTHVHGEEPGFPSVMLAIRQGRIRTATDTAAWTALPA